MCKIEGCNAEATAKGLCAKHYMRARRHGDANTVQKRGAKLNPSKDIQRKIMSQIDWSPRTFERWWLAMSIAWKSAASEEERTQIILNATRPNGSVNVSKLVRDATWLYVNKPGSETDET
jgi:hypothetical protein